MIKQSNPSSVLIIFSFIIFKYCFITTEADGSCPYPCYPPPIAGTTTPATGVASYPPPGPPAYYSPPSGGDTGYGGGALVAPPPPDAILPYFPYYYRNGVHRPAASDQTSTSAAPQWTVRIASLAAISASSALLLLSSI